MKTKITITGVIFCIISNALMAQYDLAIGNISAGWNTYTPSTGLITGVYFDVLNNENDNPGSFDVKVYLVNPTDPNDNYVVWSYTDSDGQNGNTVVTYDNIDIDFDDTPGIPSGQYRLAVCVDPDNNISETNESNNCLYISTPGNHLTYNAGSVGISDNDNDLITIYPNPASDYILISHHINDNMQLYITDVSGTIVMNTMINNQHSIIDLSTLKSGIFLYQLVNTKTNTVFTGKLIKQ